MTKPAKSAKTKKAMGTLILRAIHEALIKVECSAPTAAARERTQPQKNALQLKPADAVGGSESRGTGCWLMAWTSVFNGFSLSAGVVIANLAVKGILDVDRFDRFIAEVKTQGYIAEA
ncbi:MAG: hypothetical protein OXH63_05885, partial [Gemmatimonadetes bacterium]|nr:hypothetical protein [Gemmatimonadota bacterium]